MYLYHVAVTFCFVMEIGGKRKKDMFEAQSG